MITTLANTKPNIVLINCDDLGYGDLGCYGSSVNQTPTLDRLAAEGTRFTDFYMASPVCSPSRGAMMTGCYPRRIGFGSFDGQWVLFPGDAVGLNPEEITVARLLKDQGYATQLIGKWHCGDQPEFLPTRHGFDRYFGLPYSNDMGRQVGREHYPPLPLMDDETVIQQQPDQASLTERYVEHAIRFIRAHKQEHFFLYFAHMYVHLPLYAPARFLAESSNGSYGAAVACIDWATAVIMDELKRLGLDDNTMVIFTSDNGSRGRDEGGSNAPLRGQKGTTWEGGQRVPCIIRWPNKVAAGAVNERVVTAMDFYPTFATMAGAALPMDRNIDGHDLCPKLTGGDSDSKRPFFYYLKDNLEAVRLGPWKLHLWREGQAQQALYNLSDDIGETHNVYHDHPEIVQELEAAAERCRIDIGDELTGDDGENCRPIGRIAEATTLTQYDESHPYIVAMYDLEEAG